MSTALTTQGAFSELGLVVPQSEDKEFGLTTAGSSKFPPYLQLYGSNSNLVKEGKVPMGTFGLVYSGDKEPKVNLGAAFDCIPLAWRPKAMRLDPLTVIFQADNPEYVKIKDECDNTPKGELSGSFYGPEFLLWIPSANELVFWHCANTTARKEAKNVHARLLKETTIKSKLIKTPKYAWHGPVALACETPLDPPEASEEIKDVIAKFNARVNTIPEASNRKDTGRVR